MDIWEAVEMPANGLRLWRIGPATIWVGRTDDEWHAAIDYLSDQDMGPLETIRYDGEAPEDVEWRRWAGVGQYGAVRVTPVMPDLPVDVRPETPLSLPPACEALFFLSVPVWLRLAVGPGGQVQLCELASEPMSRAWFGEPTSGELCYSLTTRARRDYEAPGTPLNRAVCPLRIRNESAQELPLERLCVRVVHLRTYAGENRLWTNLLTMRFRGADQPAQMDYAHSAPEWERVGEPLSQARAPHDSGMLKRGFSSFRSLAGM